MHTKTQQDIIQNGSIMVDNSRTDNNNDILNEENITIIPQ
jgi:hypothetical protein